MRSSIFVGILVTVAFALPLRSAETGSASGSLDDFEKAYEKEEERLVLEKIEAVQDINRRYLAALARLADGMQAAGELEPLLAVRNEIERFEKTSAVEGGDVSGKVPELRKLQETYIRLHAQAGLDYWEGALLLADKSETWLERAQRDFTKAGDLDAALAVKQERQRIADRRKTVEAELNSARELLQSLRKDDTSPAEGEAELKPEDPAPDDSNKPNPNVERWTIEDRYTQFYRYLQADNWDRAIKFINPEDVERKGTEALKMQLRFMSGLSKLARGMNINLIGCKVTLQDAERASLVPRFVVDGERKDGLPVRWVKVDGRWYMDVN